MDNIIKISSNQSNFDTSGNKNQLDFVVQQNMGVLDLNKSYINMSVRVLADSVATAVQHKLAGETDSGIYNTFLLYGERAAAQNVIVQPNSAIFVKNASMLCKKGKVEELRNVCGLRVNRDLYLEDTMAHDEKLGGYSKTHNSTSKNVSMNSFNELFKEGTEISRVRDRNIKIPLSSIYDVAGMMDEDGEPIGWDTSAQSYGQTQFHVEMDMARITAGIGLFNGDTATADLWGGAVEDGTETFAQIEDITVAALNVTNVLTTKARYTDLQNSPFYTSMKLKFTCTAGSGGALTDVISKIQSIKHNNNGSLELTLCNNIKAAAAVGNTFTTCTVRGVPSIAGETSVIINNFELVAHMVQDSSPAQEIEYSTFLSEFDTYSGTQHTISRNYLIEANCTNVFLIFAAPTYSIEPLSEYRLSLDNKDVTNRPVYMHSPLHYDLLSRAFKNEGKLVKRLQEKFKSFDETSQDKGQAAFIIGCPVPLLDRPQRLGVELVYSGNHSGQVQLYKQIIKTI